MNHHITISTYAADYLPGLPDTIFNVYLLGFIFDISYSNNFIQCKFICGVILCYWYISEKVLKLKVYEKTDQSYPVIQT